MNPIVSLSPVSSVSFQLGCQLHAAGRLADAEATMRQILAVEPRNLNAIYVIGVIAGQTGRHGLAAEVMRSVVANAPHFAMAHFNLAIALRALGRSDEAVSTCRRAMEIEAENADIHFLLGSLLVEAKRSGEAIGVFRRAVELRPESAEMRNGLGVALRDSGNPDDAISCFDQALRINPRLPEAHYNFGNALSDQIEFDRAIEAYHEALRCRPQYPEALLNLGTALVRRCRPDEAIAVFQRLHQFQPDLPAADWNHSHALLLRGDFAEGWARFESRRDARTFGDPKSQLPQPAWRGGSVQGKRVLLYAEQGFGDTLQFIRYAPMVAASGGHVIVECQPRLKNLLHTVEGISEIIECGDALPEFDVHCSLMSLPLAFGTVHGTIPAAIPYLRADAELASRWRERLRDTDRDPRVNDAGRRTFKVGLVWAGAARPECALAHATDRRRSIHLGQLAPLAEVDGVTFISLQKGDPARQARTPPRGMTLVDWSDELRDFADTAALVDGLDLVISVDTAVLHLAAALGKPVWLLNRSDTCWRWMMGRDDSPWYPTLRQFRQREMMKWEPVIAEVRTELERTVAAFSQARPRG